MKTSSYRVHLEDLICSIEIIRAAADNCHDSYFFPMSTLHMSAAACLSEQFQRQCHFLMSVFLLRAVFCRLQAAFDSIARASQYWSDCSRSALCYLPWFVGLTTDFDLSVEIFGIASRQYVVGLQLDPHINIETMISDPFLGYGRSFAGVAGLL
jgi:hypothetical protein